ncbi:unnamed protein product, partial [Thlaspi arvense]
MKEMQSKGIEPNAITYSTINIHMGPKQENWTGCNVVPETKDFWVEIDQVLYQTMIVAYERAGLVGHAKRLLHELKHLDNMPREIAITILARA